ncbi:hypothetical protein VA249_32140 [Vibrio alfacsensis]|uniref:DUF4381 domain-containing protein n=1 Tax=Vibrio alfacsensis TaxID=1074311 RepID=UPI001BEFB25D|nr:DUF4381 domain-containing protein [Vibrio alfacsensis]BBM66568.1 hypothetical protein VA249_32140 [Vibrio alfacsensis]
MTELHTPPSTYILRELHDVTVPESVSWVPQTIGWKILAVVGAIVLMYLGYRLAHYRWDNRYRKEAIEAISRVNPDDASMPKALFSILKIVLIHLDSRHARLFDTAFLRKLDELNPKHKVFDDELSKRWLQSIVDPSIELGKTERLQLLERATEWVKEHDENAHNIEKRTLAYKARALKGGRHG